MRLWLALGSVNALLAVAFGAFGAHGLRSRVGPELLTAWESGARYHMYHALGLLAVGLLVAHRPSSWLFASGAAFQVGILLFSGSLYALVLSGMRGLGAITPIGGLAFMVGWALFLVASLRAS